MNMEKNIVLGIGIGILIFLGTVSAFILYPLTLNKPLPIIKEAPDFRLINQDNESVSLGNFNGKVIMLGFMYTSCDDPEFCPLMTLHFSIIQEELGDKLGTEAMLIMITLDPLYDTPDVLKGYGEQQGVDFKRWQLLTGQLNIIEQVVEDYDVIVYGNELEELANTTEPHHTQGEIIKPADLIHSWVSVLIDQNGMIRRIYTRSNWILDNAIGDFRSLI
jgi:protein SCO1/2